ncbi:hypothetical protein JW868_03760 [Candidatus Woesearchaeota archaeon]|nr:hypothetical protein [Candidatus Woesearchaeota archaeon]
MEERDIVNWINQQLQKGRKLREIREELVSTGINPSLINHCINQNMEQIGVRPVDSVTLSRKRIMRGKSFHVKWRYVVFVLVLIFLYLAFSNVYIFKISNVAYHFTFPAETQYPIDLESQIQQAGECDNVRLDYFKDLFSDLDFEAYLYRCPGRSAALKAKVYLGMGDYSPNSLELHCLKLSQLMSLRIRASMVENVDTYFDAGNTDPTSFIVAQREFLSAIDGYMLSEVEVSYFKLSQNLGNVPVYQCDNVFWKPRRVTTFDKLEELRVSVIDPI